MPYNFEFQYHGKTITATVESKFMPVNRQLADLVKKVEYLRKDCIENAQKFSFEKFKKEFMKAVNNTAI